MAVVVVDEDAEHVLKLPACDDEESVEALGAVGAGEALGDRFAFGARNGVRTISSPPLRKTPSKPPANLLSRSLMRKRSGAGVRQRPRQVARLSNPPPARIYGATGEVQAVAVELDEEEHVPPPEPERVDREIVAGDHCLHVRPQETPRQESPARSLAGPSPAWRRILRTLVAETRRPRPISSATTR
jgi:hypothetical protein